MQPSPQIPSPCHIHNLSQPTLLSNTILRQRWKRQFGNSHVSWIWANTATITYIKCYLLNLAIVIAKMQQYTSTL